MNYRNALGSCGAALAVCCFAHHAFAADTEGFFIEACINTNHLSGVATREALGGGLYSFLGEHFVFDAGLRFDLIGWEEETTRRTLDDGSTVIVLSPLQDDGTASKIILGVGWWF
jgi:hypothetical protein